MPAFIIIITNQKGGAGKTTLAFNLASAAQRHGVRTLLIDADTQATATRWAAQAPEGYEHQMRVMGLAATQNKIASAVRQYVEDYDLIIVDCPPSVESPIPQAMLLVADLAIIPVIPKPGDIWASTDLLAMAEQAQSINEDLKVRIMASNVVPNTGLTKLALEQLATLRPDAAPLMKSMLNQRTAYAESMLFGDSVHALGSSARSAISEVEKLYDEVAEIIGLPRVKRPAKKAAKPKLKVAA
jgi:chromosome partitioning protein